MHTYPVGLRWTGTTSTDYTRDAEGVAPGKPEIPLSAGGAFAGSDVRWNPEDLFGLSLANCHMLTFLALAKKAKIDCREYVENATVTLDSVGGVTKIVKVRLAPLIRIAAGDLETAKVLFEKAHKYCFIGSSITSEVEMAATIELIAP